MKSKLLFLYMICNFYVTAQTETTFFPSNLNISPFTANFLEPKIGFLFHFSQNDIRLDIGSSIDIVHFKKNNNETFSLGADFFTYTLLRGEQNFHFPVDAIDYLFGFNASYKKIENDTEYGLRLRLSHISAHFVDGHYDGPNQQWRNLENPIVYSREFIEAVPFYKIGFLRFYAGLTFIFHVDPAELGKNNYQIGFDYYSSPLFDNTAFPFIAYDLKIIKIDKYSANHTFVTGLKFGQPFEKGLRINLQYYSGKSVHGEYYLVNKNQFSFGINLDL